MEAITATQVKKAGKILSDPNSSKADQDKAIEIVDKWRSKHSAPIKTFQNILAKRCKTAYDGEFIVAQRLKRMESIVNKMRRFPKMNLAKMQDIAGLRVILPTVQDVYSFHSGLLGSKRLTHEPILPPKDYITSPKEDGYRSLHVVYLYNNKNKPELRNTRVEIQIRTELQHAWATAVETIDIIEKQNLKIGGISHPEYKEFFQLSSALIANKEKTGLPDKFKEKSIIDLANRAQEIEKRLKIFDKLAGFKVFFIESSKEDIKAMKAHYYLIVLSVLEDGWGVQVQAFKESGLETAKTLFHKYENEGKNTVLVSSSGVNSLMKAYPNYFLDSTKFINEMKKIFRNINNAIIRASKKK